MDKEGQTRWSADLPAKRAGWFGLSNASDLHRLKGVPVPLVVKLKAVALSFGKRLRGTTPSDQREARDNEVPRTRAPEANPAPRGAAPLTAALPNVELAPASSGQQQFARQCTLQAVFDWYQAFLERETAKDHASDEDSRKLEGESSMRAPVPGFPQFAWQLIETEPDRVRVRFFDALGSEAGVLLLRSETDRHVIEVPGGPVYVARLTTSPPDFTRDEDTSPASTSGMTGTEKQPPAGRPSSAQDAG